MTRLAPQPTPDALAPPLPRIDPITRLPILILYPHSRCNCRCLMCDIWRSTTRDEIAPEAIAGWLSEWRELGVQRVVLSGGEALMHRQLAALCEHLQNAGIGITILSTGLLLRRHAELIARYCDDLVLSLDGPQEVHDRIRNVPGAFARMAEGITAVRSESRDWRFGGNPQSPNLTISITARCTVQRENFRHLRATVAAARELGVDRVSFLAADVSSEAFNRPGGWEEERSASVALASEELPALAAELAALAATHAAEFANGFIAEAPEKLHKRLYQHFAALAGVGDFAPLQCNAPWVSSVVEADGTVRPCFFQPAFGNIYRDGGLAAVINSPAAIAWRQQLDVVSDPICRRCVCSLNLREG
jgi:Fe-coproporphyrin III synthase